MAAISPLVAASSSQFCGDLDNFEVVLDTFGSTSRPPGNNCRASSPTSCFVAGCQS
jgi:hypothetical protein